MIFKSSTFRIPNSDFRIPASLTSDPRLPTSDLRPLITDLYFTSSIVLAACRDVLSRRSSKSGVGSSKSED